MSNKQEIKNLQTKIKLLRKENETFVDEIARLNSVMDKKTETLLAQSESIKKLNSEIESLKVENLKLSDQITEIQKPLKETVTKKSQNIAGWTVTKDQDGYFRARRFINGKTRCVYVGKRITKASKIKIQKKERDLREAV